MRACGLSLDCGHMTAESTGAEHGLRREIARVEKRCVSRHAIELR